ncbi:PepSY domain-containing protein [Streptomyces sp. NPDC052079]|uniref:PepSY domain-containing protein n=1 Tax=Streptomyces sp. NPDC052079 TaxID=3155526 RepID=UPI00344610E8
MKRNIVIAVVAAAALVGGGTATAIGGSGGEDGGSGSGSVSSPAVRAGDDDGGRDDRDERAVSGVTAADAIAAALKHTPGTAVSAELDDDGSWEVEVLGRGDDWRSVRVDPGSGKVLGAWADYEDDAGEVRAALKGASVSAQEAAEVAGAKGTVVSVELDDDGDLGWEAETRGSSGGERDWRVDVRSGEVSVERGDDGGDSADD